jgi:putative membrane protein
MEGGMARTAWLAGSAAALATVPAWAQYQGGYYGPGHMWDGGWWMLLGPLWMIVVIGALVAAVVLLARWLGGTGFGGSQARGSKALDILRERFARGEIDKTEFEERRKLLE